MTHQEFEKTRSEIENQIGRESLVLASVDQYDTTTERKDIYRADATARIAELQARSDAVFFEYYGTVRY